MKCPITGLVLLLAASSVPAADKPAYEFKKDHDPDGTGKFYMGREIAHVMGYLARAGWSGPNA